MPNLFFIKDIKKSNCSCTNFDGKKKYIATADLQNGKIVNYEVVDFNSKPSRANLIAVNGSVIFAKMQNTIKVLEIDDSNVDNIYSTGFYSFKDERILPSYMKFFFESTLFNTIKDKNCHGATMKAINDEEMSKISINVPSIQIQKKIIDELSKITELINFNKNNLVNLDKVVKSQFIEMFGTLESMKDSTIMMSDVIEVNPKKDIIDDDTLVTFLPMEKVGTDGKIDVSLSKKYHEVKKGFNHIKENDVLFAKITPCMENGKSTIARGLKNGYANSTTELFCLRCSEQVVPEYIFHIVHSKEFRNEAEENMTGSAGQKRVPKSFVEEYPILIPSLQLQNKFADFVQQIDKSKYFGGVRYAIC